MTLSSCQALSSAATAHVAAQDVNDWAGAIATDYVEAGDHKFAYFTIMKIRYILVAFHFLQQMMTL